MEPRGESRPDPIPGPRYWMTQGMDNQFFTQPIFIGPEFGTVSRPDLARAAREGADAGFAVLIACAFNYDAHSSEFNKPGRVPVLRARINANLQQINEEARASDQRQLTLRSGDSENCA